MGRAWPWETRGDDGTQEPIPTRPHADRCWMAGIQTRPISCQSPPGDPDRLRLQVKHTQRCLEPTTVHVPKTTLSGRGMGEWERFDQRLVEPHLYSRQTTVTPFTNRRKAS